MYIVPPTWPRISQHVRNWVLVPSRYHEFRKHDQIVLLLYSQLLPQAIVTQQNICQQINMSISLIRITESWYELSKLKVLLPDIVVQLVSNC